MKDRFRKFWLATVADGFKDDLEEIRKVRSRLFSLVLALSFEPFLQEPNLGSSRLALLIDSLASGADVFANQNENSTSEMDIVLN